MQHAREGFLAHAGFPGEQHRRLSRGHAIELMAGGVEGGRSADHVVWIGFARNCGGRRRRRGACGGGFTCRGAGAGEVLRLQIADILADVAPGFRVLADHAAHACARGAALDFAEHHEAPEQRGDVAHRIAELHPAGRLGPHTEGGDVLVVLAAVMPEEFAGVVAAVDVEIELYGLDAGDAFEGVQPRSGHEHRGDVALRPAFAHQLRVARAGDVAGAREQAAGALDAQRVDQLTAQLAEGRAVDELHALVVEPDATVARGEEHAFRQVRQGGDAFAAEMFAVGAP